MRTTSGLVFGKHRDYGGTSVGKILVLMILVAMALVGC